MDLGLFKLITVMGMLAYIHTCTHIQGHVYTHKHEVHEGMCTENMYLHMGQLVADLGYVHTEHIG